MEPKKRGRPRKVTPPETPPVSEEAKEYVIELIFGDMVLSSSGDTIVEALKGLERPVKVLTKGYVRIQHGERVKQLFFVPRQMQRLFQPLSQVVVAKMLGMNL